MPSSLKAVAFDAYGTLFDVYSVGALAEDLFAGRGAALAAMWRDKQIQYSQLRTLCDRYEDFWQVTADALDHAADALGLRMDSEARERLLQGYWHLRAFPENVEALQQLRARGLRLAILSNGSPAMLDAAVSAAGMQGLLDRVLSADAVRRFKTAPEVYELGPEAFGLQASEILFVSSNGWDICGATWFGFTTFWVNRAGNPPERLGVVPAGQGRSLDDVVEFIDARTGRSPA